MVGLILLVFFGVFVVSCNEVERHKVLTFFFEGVPPLGQEHLSEEPVANDLRTSSQAGQQIWFVHEPRKNCTNCHDKSKQSKFAPQTYLIKSIPELCYGCHDDFRISAAYVHGPVANGKCLFCHHHHQSKIEHLLLKPEPELCLDCHNVGRIDLIPGHIGKLHLKCTECHDPHKGSARYFLKENLPRTESGVNGIESADETVQKQARIEQKDRAGGFTGPKEIPQKTESEKNSMFQLFWTVSKLIEKGQIKEARASLEQFKQSNAFTDERWGKIVQVLNLMDIAVNQSEEYAEKNERQDDASDAEAQSRIPGSKKTKEIAELYYRSMAFYYSGQVEKAREGFLEVLKSEIIPPAVVKTIKDDLAGIDSRLTVGGRTKEIAELYYRSMAFYHAGEYEKAREGLVKVLNSGLVPAPMIITIKDCLIKIDKISRQRVKP